MTENHKAALAWAKRNESRAKKLFLQASEAWRCKYQREGFANDAHALLDEAARMRAYAAQSSLA